MHRTFPLLLALGLVIASSLNAALPLNPLEWFEQDSTEEAAKIATQKNNASATGQLEIAQAKYDAGKLKSANRTLKKLIKKYPLAPSTGDALALSGKIYMEQGKWRKGFDRLQQVIDKHAGYEHFDNVISSQFECATKLMEGARGKILWVFPGFTQYGTATTQFETIVRNAPYNDYAPLALMNIAIVCSEKRNEPLEAIDALDRLINYYPQSMLAPDAYYNLAETYSDLVQSYEYDQGSTRQAISYYEDFLILFPNSDYTGEVEARLKTMENTLASSRLSLGDFYYYYRNNNTAALVFYNETISVEPDSDAAQIAIERIKDIEAGVRPTNTSSIIRKFLRAE